MAKTTNSLPCPICGASTGVAETRGMDDEVQRKRKCHGPVEHRFITREVFLRDVGTNTFRSLDTRARALAGNRRGGLLRAAQRAGVPPRPKVMRMKWTSAQRDELYDLIAINVARAIVDGEKK